MPKVTWFEIPTDDMERAKTFYGKLFGWEMEKVPGDMDYWFIKTEKGAKQEDATGGLTKRQYPGQPITNYVEVDSIDNTLNNVESLGGKVTLPRTQIPEHGSFAVCKDTEGNIFALWEKFKGAKC